MCGGSGIAAHIVRGAPTTPSWLPFRARAVIACAAARRVRADRQRGGIGMAGTVVRNDGEGDAYWVLGGLYEVKVSSDESNGSVTVMEFTIPEGAGPPPHIHDGDETVRVLEGSARFHVGDETVELGPGSVVFYPAGTQEPFEPVGQV